MIDRNVSFEGLRRSSTAGTKTSNITIAALISYEVAAVTSQRAGRVPSLPLISTVVRSWPVWARWVFVTGVAGVLADHLILSRLP